jgi:hypothetical protein
MTRLTFLPLAQDYINPQARLCDGETRLISTAPAITLATNGKREGGEISIKEVQLFSRL